MVNSHTYQVTIIGTGYVGLVTGVTLAQLGADVVCVDSDPAKLARLRLGEMPIYEPYLEPLVRDNMARGKLSFTDDLATAVRAAEIIFISVGTPSQLDGNVDLTAVSAVANAIGRALDTARNRIVINKSTVPIGSGDWVAMLIQEGIEAQKLSPSLADTGVATLQLPARPLFEVVSNPEFLREGCALADSFYPERIVLGSNSPWALERVQELYAPIVQQEFEVAIGPPRPANRGRVPLVLTDPASAELIKYAANAFLATKISFINEIANIAERLGANINEVAQGIGLDSRIGPKFLQAGLGWGGSCFQKDIFALIQMAQEYNYNPAILPAVIEVNTGQRRRVIQKLQEALKIIKGKTIGILGLAFKPDTDDLREAPSLYLANRLLEMGARVKVTDPIAMPHCRSTHPDLHVIYCEDAVETADGADALVLVTEWPQFLTQDFEQLAARMRQRVLVDGRNALDGEALRRAGFTYIGVGV